MFHKRRQICLYHGNFSKKKQLVILSSGQKGGKKGRMKTMKKEQGTKALLVSIVTALLLTIVKGFAGIISGSLAVLSSALDSFIDAWISGANLFVFRAASKPADEDHSFGHGKFEAFAEFFQGLLIGIAALILGYFSLQRFYEPREISSEYIVLGSMFFSFLVTLALAIFLYKSAKQTSSLVVKADMAHYTSDVLAALSVLLGSLFIFFGAPLWIDALLSLGISLLLFKTAFELLKEGFEVLTDREIGKDKRQKIVHLLDSFPHIEGWHFLRTRRVGSQIHIDAHLVFPDGMSLRKAHALSDDLVDQILQIFPRSVILFHLDPSDDSRANEEMYNRG